MKKILVALVLVCLGSAALWASLDHPLDAPDWRGQFKGVAYTPSHLYSEADKDQHITEAMLRQDLEQLSKVTKRVRTYTVGVYGVEHPDAFGQDRIPYLAKEYGMKVTLGIWLGDNKTWNEEELARGIQVINDNPTTVDRVIVGNEAVGVRGELKAEDIVGYIKRVKRGITNKRIEVGTTDVWGTWMRDPGMADVAKASDFVGIHLLPYWEGISLDKSMDYITTSFGYVQKKFPGKKIVIGETGWPSQGRVKKGSVPSAAMEGAYLRRFLSLAVAKNYDYYIMEAFDQPWKAGQEGAVGAYWGMLDATGAPKFSMTGPLTSFPQWPAYAATAAAATFLIGLIILWLMPVVSLPGYVLTGSIVAIVVTGALFVIDASSLRYVDWSTLGGALFVVPVTVFTALLLITETCEWALSLWRVRRTPLPRGDVGTPMVSIHLPTHNEPPEMVVQTLNALAKLDYPRFEVIVLDNNTADEGLWRPVQAHCMALGHQFRFYHFENMKGFKAGALNKALELTSPEATLVGVVDSDYQVSPEWLKTVVPAFVQDEVAVVQAPQDYRDADESLFKTLCYEEYTSFFRVGMVERNEHNAIIQHGTMCVIRRSALEAVGRWAEWCITEDTELGLRLFEAGYTAHYTPVSMGRGLMPDTYDAYKAQRYRWVYGAMQIMKRHAHTIFTGKSKLTLAQRYHFVAGWLPWLADGLALIFGVLALVWTALVALAPKMFDVPLTALSSVALALFTIKTVKTITLHRTKVSKDVLGAVGAALTGLSLSYTVGKGVLTGIFTSSKPFLRTPKCEDTAPWTHALRIAAFETAMLVGTALAILTTLATGQIGDPAETMWIATLAVLAVPNAAAVLVALGSTVKLGRRRLPVSEIAPAFTSAKSEIAA